MANLRKNVHSLDAGRAAGELVYGEREGDGHFIELSLYTLFWIFVLMSFVGLVVETLVSWPIDGELRHRAGFLWGPFSPIYGVGAVLFTVALNNMKDKHILLLFVRAALVGGALEAFAGCVLKNAFGILAWSYIDRPLNFFGYTCVEMMCVWGLAGVAWMKIAVRPVARLVNSAPNGYFRSTVTTLFAFFIAADTAMTIASVCLWFDRAVGNLPETPIEQYFAATYNDEFMAEHFEVASMHVELASR